MNTTQSKIAHTKTIIVQTKRTPIRRLLFCFLKKEVRGHQFPIQRNNLHSSLSGWLAGWLQKFTLQY